MMASPLLGTLLLANTASPVAAAQVSVFTATMSPKVPVEAGCLRAAQLLAAILSLHLDHSSGFSCRPQRQIQRYDEELRPHFYVHLKVLLSTQCALALEPSRRPGGASP